MKGPSLVNNNHSFIDVGDEAILHLKSGKTCISKNKIEGANFCKKNDANLIILDDGLQSKNIKKDISILVVDGYYGNNELFPAGPLRETIKKTLKKCDAILIIEKLILIIKILFLIKKNFFAKKL